MQLDPNPIIFERFSTDSSFVKENMLSPYIQLSSEPEKAAKHAGIGDSVEHTSLSAAH